MWDRTLFHHEDPVIRRQKYRLFEIRIHNFAFGLLRSQLGVDLIRFSLFILGKTGSDKYEILQESLIVKEVDGRDEFKKLDETLSN